MPPKIALILALVIAAAVLAPLRRARKAFPVRSEVAGIVGAPRTSTPRRRTSPRPGPHARDVVASGNFTAPPVVRDASAVGATRRVPHAGKAVTSFAGKHNPDQFPTPNRLGETRLAPQGDDDLIADQIGPRLRPNPLARPSGSASRAVAMRLAADVPVPPPKPAV